jgi:hypothetical protein
VRLGQVEALWSPGSGGPDAGEPAPAALPANRGVLEDGQLSR